MSGSSPAAPVFFFSLSPRHDRVSVFSLLSYLAPSRKGPAHTDVSSGDLAVVLSMPSEMRPFSSTATEEVTTGRGVLRCKAITDCTRDKKAGEAPFSTAQQSVQTQRDAQQHSDRAAIFQH